MNETTLYWIAEVLGKGVVWLGVCLVLSRWGAAREMRIWRVGWLMLGAMTLLSLAPAVWRWTWTEPTRRVLDKVEASLAPIVLSEVEVGVPVVESSTVGPASFSTVPAWTRHEWMLVVWLAGVATTGGWLGWGFWLAHRWRREAVDVDDPEWDEALRREAKAMASPLVPRLAVHATAPAPCLVGVGRRPTIMLPPECHRWDAETRRTVLRHELAHLIGQDGRFAVLRSVLLALHWPNPMAWVAAAADIREQELAADRRVLVSGVDAGVYALLLLRLARRLPCGPIPASCQSMASLSRMEGRFREILRGHGPATSKNRLGRVTLALGAIVVAVGAGCSSYRSAASDPSALPGARTPRTPVMDADLQAHLRTSPSDDEIITLKFRLVDVDGQLVGISFFNSLHPGATTATGPMRPSIQLRRKTHRWAVPGRIEIIKEFPYPTVFNFPDLTTATGDESRARRSPGPATSDEPVDNPGSARFPVTPTTPLAFKKKTTGYTIDDIWVEPKAAFLLIQGRFIETLFDGFIEGAGEAFSPIMAPATTALGRPTTVVLTENKVQQPTFTTRETPFVVSALPGKAYRIRLNSKQPGWFLEVTAEPWHP